MSSFWKKNKDADLESFNPQLEAIKREFSKRESSQTESGPKVFETSPSVTDHAAVVGEKDLEEGTTGMANTSQDSANPTPIKNGASNSNGQFGYSNGNGNGNGNGKHPTPSVLKTTVISEGFEFKGEIIGDGALTVEGSVIGKIRVNSLNISVTGLVDGDVEAGLINVKGQLLGSVDCETLTIAGRASVDGKVSYQSIQIQRGGLFRGDIVKK